MNIWLLFGPKYWTFTFILIQLYHIKFAFHANCIIQHAYQFFYGSQYPMQKAKSSLGISAGRNLMQPIRSLKNHLKKQKNRF